MVIQPLIPFLKEMVVSAIKLDGDWGTVAIPTVCAASLHVCDSAFVVGHRAVVGIYVWAFLWW